MKVKCIMTTIDPTENKIINWNMKDLLELDSDYYVYSIRIINNISYYLMYTGTQLIPIPSKMFKVINSNIPEIWITNINEKGNIFIGPKLFLEDYFIDSFSDFQDRERNEFEKIRHLMEI